MRSRYPAGQLQHRHAAVFNSNSSLHGFIMPRGIHSTEAEKREKIICVPDERSSNVRLIEARKRLVIIMAVHFKQTFLKSIFKNRVRMASHFASTEKSAAEIRTHLAKFTGGSVDLIKRDDGLAIIVLNQEKKKNAMSGKMMVDLYDVVEELSSWEAGKGVILKGASGNFCSGGDLNFVRQVATPEEGFMMATYMQNILNKFQRLPVISVALVEGTGALGGGGELSVACDFILASETCYGIGFVHARMGLIPAWGGTNRLIEKIGYTKALELISTAKILGPRECLAVGLIDDIIPANADSESYAISWLKERTRFDTHLMRSIKASVSWARDLPRDYETERRIFAPLWGGPAHKEALQKNQKFNPK